MTSRPQEEPVEGGFDHCRCAFHGPALLQGEAERVVRRLREARPTPAQAAYPDLEDAMRVSHFLILDLPAR